MTYDCIVVGGSFAGLAAATQLARARRQVLVVDAGRPRNRFTTASHGLLGQDGRAPAAIIHDARAQVLAYPTVDFAKDVVEQARIEANGFSVSLASGWSLFGARLVLATGVVDELPKIPGLSARWGMTVLHCPYCHGYEIAADNLGVLAESQGSLSKALLLSDWGNVTLFTNGVIRPTPDEQAALCDRGVSIEHEGVEALIGQTPGLEAVRLKDGRLIPIGAMFISPRTGMASPLAQQLGCAFVNGALGPVIRTDSRKETRVPGVFAAGDAARATQSASWAVADGVSAGIGAHQSLIDRPDDRRLRRSA